LPCFPLLSLTVVSLHDQLRSESEEPRLKRFEGRVTVFLLKQKIQFEKFQVWASK